MEIEKNLVFENNKSACQKKKSICRSFVRIKQSNYAIFRVITDHFKNSSKKTLLLNNFFR